MALNDFKDTNQGGGVLTVSNSNIGKGIKWNDTTKKYEVDVDVLVSTEGGVAVLTGEIAHEGTLPIPSGFTESQCHFFVSMKYAGPNGVWWDWNENVNGKQSSTECYVSGRTVICQTYVNEDGNGSGHGELGSIPIPGVANYLVIAVK